MRKLFLLLALLQSLAVAGGPKWSYPEVRGLDDEMNNLYHDIRSVPNGTYGSSSMTLQGITADSATIRSLIGVSDGSSACPDCIGRYVSSTVGNQAAPTSTQWGDVTSISLSAGDWDVTFTGAMNQSGATVTDQNFGIGIISGNNSPGATQTYDFVNFQSGTKFPTFIRKQFSLTSTTIVYAKMNFTWTGGSVFGLGSLQARRVR